MLKSWAISNFKSFGDRTEIDLAPITVIAGANSSGKSTILQSILLLKQTVQYVPVSRAIGLNGPILKLGRFDDIKNATSKSNSISLEWELTEVGAYKPQGGQENLGFMYYGMYTNIDVENVKYGISFAVDDDLSREQSSSEGLKITGELRQLQPVLEQVYVYADYHNKDNDNRFLSSARLKLSRKSSDIMSHDESRTGSHEAAKLLSYKIDYIDSSTKSEISQQRPDPRLLGANVQHFLPYQIGMSYNKRRDLSYKAAVVITSTPHSHQYQFDREAISVIIDREVALYILEIIEDKFAQESFPQFRPSPHARLIEAKQSVVARSYTAGDFSALLDSTLRWLDARSRAAVRATLNDCLVNIQEKIGRSLELSTDIGFQASSPRVMWHVADQANNFFRHSIRYLGPLRDEPKPIYPLEAVANPTDVGYKGEHTAAVLDLNRDRQVTYISSSNAQLPIGARPITTSLHSAVVDWLTYLGVAEGVRTSDLGKMGHQLQVKTGGIAKEHDLTNVGVGVSQLLPIIVMALLSPIPSTLIFEQPELHLHPRVQTRLADFFISLGLSRRQCILETHSEYMIERLRRRIAEAEEDLLQSSIKIYFTHRVEGNTVCEAIQVTKYGAIKNWPPDFFDQSQEETAEILKAAQRKLKIDRQNSKK
ncbi:DUF3696 domain-containing protein [Methylobacterium sp. SyP6R]|uniref:DUF3696 domain-containing protein n=1 Tax=Methylobacterium sp. SyP6R TaxID=2718876 RepID=UPI001F206E22|nr:DUF3696 domain-containing protein [Methylobacterium sp. SyP6R]MCF4125180.1 DUF3696 domain-containing protein [Methylobacterium sp. SyP6R]